MNDLDPAWLDELGDWLRIPSVSADPAHEADVRAAGQWVCDFVTAAGGGCALVETDTHPLAVGEIRASQRAEAAPTVLLYGHFDVQSPGDLALWDSPPFEPEIRDGWLYGRGTVDDKGNLYLLLKAAALLAAEGALPVNVRIVCDGEEETGGHSVVDYLVADERGAAACLVFDSGMPEIDVPAFDIATRGICYFHVTARTGERDLHSGIYGGAALNAIHALTASLAAVTAVPQELRAGVAEPSAEERDSWKALTPGAEVLAREGAVPLDGPPAPSSTSGPAAARRSTSTASRRAHRICTRRSSRPRRGRTSRSGWRRARAPSRSQKRSSGSCAAPHRRARRSRSSAGPAPSRAWCRPTRQPSGWHGTRSSA